MTKQQEALQIVGRFLKLQAMGYAATAAECQQMANLCFILLPMKYRLSKEDRAAMKQEVMAGNRRKRLLEKMDGEDREFAVKEFAKLGLKQ